MNNPVEGVEAPLCVTCELPDWLWRHNPNRPGEWTGPFHPFQPPVSSTPDEDSTWIGADEAILECIEQLASADAASMTFDVFGQRVAEAIESIHARIKALEARTSQGGGAFRALTPDEGGKA